MQIQKLIYQILIVLAFSQALRAASPSSFTYEGILTDTSGNPVDLNGQTITFSIVDASSCVMYEETSTAAGGTSGLISHAVGTGSVVYGTFASTLFNSAQTGSGGCTVTNTATRYLKVSVASPAISATVNLTSVPYALESTAVGGYSAPSLLRTDNTVASVTAFNNTEYTKLLDLIAGTSSQYVQQSSPVFSSSPQYSGAPSGGSDLTNKNYVDNAVSGASISGDITGSLASTTLSKIQTKPVTLTGLANRDILQYTGTAWVNRNIPACTGGQTLTFDGTSYSCVSGGGGGVSSLTANVPLSATASTGSVTLSIAYDNSTINLNGSNQLQVKDASLTPAKLTGGTSGDVLYNLAGIWSSGSPNTAGLFVNGGNSFGGTATLGTNDSNALKFLTGTTTRMLIDTEGKVLIGTLTDLSPTAKLQVTGESQLDGEVWIENKSSSTVTRTTSLGLSHFSIGGAVLSPRIQFGASKSAGGAPMAANDEVGRIEFDNPNSGWRNGASIVARASTAWSSTTQGTQLEFYTNTNAGTAYSGPLRMIVDQAGNVGLGTSSPSAKLDVAGTTKLGASGVAFTSMGGCSITSFSAGAGATVRSCLGLPAGAAVSCSPTTSPGSTTTWSAWASAADQVTIQFSGSAFAASWKCMWMMP